MKHLKVYKVYEANEQPVENKSDSQGRSERLTTQAQKEYKEGPELQKKSGPVPTMVFTDVVGSSKMWSDDPITMIGQLEAHHKLVDTIAQKIMVGLLKQ